MIDINLDMPSQLHANYHTGYPLYKCSFVPIEFALQKNPNTEQNM